MLLNWYLCVHCMLHIVIQQKQPKPKIKLKPLSATLNVRWHFFLYLNWTQYSKKNREYAYSNRLIVVAMNCHQQHPIVRVRACVRTCKCQQYNLYKTKQNRKKMSEKDRISEGFFLIWHRHEFNSEHTKYFFPK